MSYTTNAEQSLTLEEYLASEKQAIIQHLKVTRKWFLRNFDREEFIDRDSEDYSGIEVRLQCVDGSWYILTGSPDFDTSHRGYWGHGSIDYDIEVADLDTNIGKLVDSLIEQVLDAEAESTL